MKKFILVLVVAFASVNAQASNPLSDFCRAVVAEGQNGASFKSHPQEALICAYQRDHGLEEMGNINNPTCQHMAKRIRTEFDGKKVQFTADSAEEVVYSRCVEMGSVEGRGGIVIVTASPSKPAGERPVVDAVALKARRDAKDKAREALVSAEAESLKAATNAQEAIAELSGAVQKPDKPVRPPTVGEGVVVTASTGVIGGLGGSGIAALSGAAVLSTGLLTGGVGLAVGAVGTLIWWAVSDDEPAAVVSASTRAVSP